MQERYDSLEYNYAFRALVADALLGSSSGKRKKLPSWLLQLCKVGRGNTLGQSRMCGRSMEEN